MMSRAADQRVVYALKNGRLVPKSEVEKVAGASVPAAAEAVVDDEDQAENSPAPFSATDADQPRRRGRPAKVREDAESDTSAFEIKD